MTVEEMNEEIGSDSLGFLSQKSLVETISQGKGFCLGCFSGVYPVAAPMETPKERMD
jgi:amidophosphoribosyltransferase